MYTLSTKAVDVLQQLPKEKILDLPTPLEDWGRLGGKAPVVLGKRDDIGPLALGGNKLRKLEFELAKAKAHGADTLVTTGGIQSNHARLTAALAARNGMECHLILDGEDADQIAGNLLIDYICGAEVTFVKEPVKNQDQTVVADFLKRLKDSGRNPYWIPLGGASALGTISYVQGFKEFYKQAKELGINSGTITVAAGTGSTVAGIALGNFLKNSPYKINAVSVSRDKKTLEKDIRHCISLGLKKLSLSESLAEDVPLEVKDEYIGAGYTKVTDESLNAIKTFGSRLGVLVDLTYTGKAAAAFLEEISSDSSSNHIFWHTGGAPEIFNRPQNTFNFLPSRNTNGTQR